MLRTAALCLATLLCACSNDTPASAPACDGSACHDATTDAPHDAPSDAACEGSSCTDATAEASVDAGPDAPRAPGVACGQQSCTGQISCCSHDQDGGFLYECSLTCPVLDAGTEAHVLVCDDVEDCPAGSICCTDPDGGLQAGTHCATDVSCKLTGGTVICDPGYSPECPGKCTGTVQTGGLTLHTCQK